MIEVGTKLLLAESGGWQVLRVRAARLPLSALAWLLLGVPATTQAAAAAAATAFIFYFFPEKCRVQTPTPSAQAAAQLVSYGLFNLDFSLLPSPFQAGSPKLIKQRGRKKCPPSKECSTPTPFSSLGLHLLAPRMACGGHWPLPASFWKWKACVKEPLL